MSFFVSLLTCFMNQCIVHANERDGRQKDREKRERNRQTDRAQDLSVSQHSSKCSWFTCEKHVGWMLILPLERKKSLKNSKEKKSISSSPKNKNMLWYKTIFPIIQYCTHTSKDYKTFYKNRQHSCRAMRWKKNPIHSIIGKQRWSLSLSWLFMKNQ